MNGLTQDCLILGRKILILFIVPCIFLIIAYKHSIAIDASGKQITEASARMQELIDRVELLEKQVSQPSVVMTTHGDELKDLMRAVSETMNLMNSELNDLRKRIHSFDGNLNTLEDEQ